MNKIRTNLHTHTTYSDGADSLEAYILAALEKGFTDIGFSEHCDEKSNTDGCILLDNIPRYIAEIKQMQEKYAGKINLYTGIEYEHYVPFDLAGMDYCIGSVHYLFDKYGRGYCIDDDCDTFVRAVDAVSEGSVQALVERYYEELAAMVAKKRPTIVGHLDLVVKLNDGKVFFDTDSCWYRAAIREVVEEIAKTDCIVEVNTGGMFRGYTQQPYPDPETLQLLKNSGIPVMITSDAHTIGALDYFFDEAAQLLRDAGFLTTRQMIDGAFVDIEL